MPLCCWLLRRRTGVIAQSLIFVGVVNWQYLMLICQVQMTSKHHYLCPITSPKWISVKATGRYLWQLKIVFSTSLMLLVPRHLVSLLVSTPVWIVNRCWSGFPCKWQYINVQTSRPFNLYQFKRVQFALHTIVWCVICSSACSSQLSSSWREY